MDLGALRAQALLYAVAVQLHLRLSTVRRRPQSRPDDRISPGPGIGRSCNGAFIAGHYDGDISARGTATRDGDLGRRDDGSAGHRAYAGRLDYRQLELALEFLYQRSSRHRRIAYGLGLRP